jgi:transcriptional regulator with XRE-family HTH domain
MVVIIVNRLKVLREEKKMTQKELGTLIGVQLAAISKYELSVSSLTDDLITKFCKIFDVSADYLLGLSNDRHRKVSISEIDDIVPTYDGEVFEVSFSISGPESEANASKEKITKFLNKNGFKYSVIPETKTDRKGQSLSDEDLIFLSLTADLTSDEKADVQKYIDFVKSKRTQ